MLFPFVAFLLGDTLLIALSLPLLLRKVRPNQLYGLRSEATLADEWVWYEANAKSARDLIAVAVAHLVLTASVWYGGYLTQVAPAINAIVLALAVVATAWIGSKRANGLLAERRQ